MDGLSMPAYRSAVACLSGSRHRRLGSGINGAMQSRCKKFNDKYDTLCWKNADVLITQDSTDIWWWFMCVNSCFKYYLLIFRKGEIKGVRDLTVFQHVVVFLYLWGKVLFICFMFSFSSFTLTCSLIIRAVNQCEIWAVNTNASSAEVKIDPVA